MKKIIVLMFICLVSFAACTKKTQENNGAQNSDPNPKKFEGSLDEIRIGAIFSLTGGTASFGTSSRDGINIAIKQINAQGGINGKKISLILLDDQSKPDEAATIMTRLISQDHVNAVLGEVASSISLAMAPIAQTNKIPMLSPSSTNPKVTQVGDFIFRTCFIDPFQGTVMAKFAFNSLGLKKVAILRDIKNDYSVGLANYFAKTFKEMGGEILVDQSYSEGDVDFKSQLTSIKAQNPEAIFVPGYYTEVGLIARQARESGIEVPLLGGDGWDSTKLVEIGGKAMRNTYFSNHYAPDDPSPAAQGFITAFKEAYGTIPDGMAVTGYDAMMVLANAIKTAGSADPQKIRDALATTKDYPGASGMISINDMRDAVKPAVVLEVKDGKFIFKEKVNP